jgi:DNA-3-methyladenine glycosylase II
MAAHIARIGPPSLRPRGRGFTHFEVLARAIAYQQLAGRAAATIWGRARALVDGPFTPEAVLALSEEAMRGAGLSGAKTASIRDLAAHVAAGALRLGRIGAYDDEAIIEQLTLVRGIGRWTAEMFLMFQLGRRDVWPVGDLGVRNGYALIYGVDPVPTAKELAEHGERFRPWRSVAAWYCWRAVDVVLPDA